MTLNWSENIWKDNLFNIYVVHGCLWLTIPTNLPPPDQYLSGLAFGSAFATAIGPCTSFFSASLNDDFASTSLKMKRTVHEQADHGLQQDITDHCSYWVKKGKVGVSSRGEKSITWWVAATKRKTHPVFILTPYTADDKCLASDWTEIITGVQLW